MNKYQLREELAALDVLAACAAEGDAVARGDLRVRLIQLATYRIATCSVAKLCEMGKVRTVDFGEFG